MSIHDIPIPGRVSSALLGITFMITVVVVAAWDEGERVRNLIRPPVLIALEESSLTAQAAVIYDPTNKHVLFSKNANEPLPLASLTKLMSAQAVLSHKELNDRVKITSDDLRPDGDNGFKVGEVWSLKDLLAIGLVASSNDAMAAVASSLGGEAITQMNKTATDLGLSQTYFINPTGLDEDVEVAGAYGSAHDIAVLASTFFSNYPSVFEQSASDSVRISNGTQTLTALSTAGSLLDIPGFIAAKTGYTDLAGGNLVVVFDIDLGHPLVAVALGSTREGRFEDIRTLISAAREHYYGNH